MSTSRRARTKGAFAAVVLVATACTPGASSSEDDDDTASDVPVEATVTVPPIRLTPFCQAMIDLAERLEQDPPDDVAAEIIATYERIAPDVPDAIRTDFEAVLADLRGDTPATPTTSTTSEAPSAPPPPNPSDTATPGGSLPPGDAFFDEGYGPDDAPALRLNAYVDFECRDVANNPGPPPTQPLSEPETSDPADP